MAKWLENEGEQLTKRRELRRDTILQAAARCFRKAGYHKTTLDDIARELQVSKAALYYYIESKEQIYFDCNEIAVDFALDGLAAAERLGGGASEKLRFALSSYIENGLSTMKGAVVLYESGTLPPDMHRRIVRKRDTYEKELRALVASGVKDGVFKPCEEKMVVFAILGAISWVSKWYSPGGKRSAKEIASAFADYLVSGLLVPAAAGTNQAESKSLSRTPRARRRK